MQYENLSQPNDQRSENQVSQGLGHGHNYWKDAYSDMSNSNHGSQRPSSNHEHNALDFGSASSLYGTSQSSDAQLTKDVQSLAQSVQNGDFAGALKSIGQTFQDLSSEFNATQPGVPATSGDTATTNTTASSPSDNNAVPSTTSTSDANAASAPAAPFSDTTTTAAPATSSSDTTTASAPTTTSSVTTPPTSSDTGDASAAANAVATNVAPLTLSQVTSMQDSTQNTVFPDGGIQNLGFGWAKGASGQWPIPGLPTNADETVPWITAYPINGTKETPGSSITTKNMNSYALLDNGSWVPLSTTNTGNQWAQTNPDNMSGIINANPSVTQNADGSFTLQAPPDDQVNQYGGPGGTFDNSHIVGVYDSAQVKANSDNSNTAVQLGADYYDNGIYIEGIGTSNWVGLTDQYQSIAFTNISAQTLADNPPPGMTST